MQRMYMSIEMSNELKQVQLGLVMNVVNAIKLWSLWHNSCVRVSYCMSQPHKVSIKIWMLPHLEKHKIPMIWKDMNRPRSQELNWHTHCSFSVCRWEEKELPLPWDWAIHIWPWGHPWTKTGSKPICSEGRSSSVQFSPGWVIDQFHFAHSVATRTVKETAKAWI